MRRVMMIVGGIVALLVVVVGVGWLGLKVNASSFETPALETRDLGTEPIPADLPEPVRRHVEAVLGDEMQQVETALVMGTAHLTLNGLTFPTRFKFYYEAGEGYYRDMELTWFDRSIIKVPERYQDGVMQMKVPGELIEDEPQVNAGANQSLWGESLIWAPETVFGDPRVTWETVNDTTAIMRFPGADESEAFSLTFDPDTGLLQRINTLRYKEAGNTERQRWINTVVKWEDRNGRPFPVDAATQWNDEPPWAEWHVEQVLYNVDITARMNQFGGDVVE